MAVQSFHAADYAVLVAVLGLSSSIGVYFAWKDRRSTNNKEFLVGNRQLQVFPVTMSMMASFLSSVAILGIPSQNFIHGSQYMVNFIGLIIGVFLAANVFLPVFYEIDMISANQYLEKRFKSVALRKVICATTVLRNCFYMGVVLYGPSLALGSVTGLPVWVSILVNGAVCAFYTTIAALLSMCTGLGLAFWVAVGGIAYPGRPMVARTSLEMCAFNYTPRVPPPRTYYSGGIMELYHISYLWIPVISFFTTFLLAIIITILLGLKNADDVEPNLIAPVLRNIYQRTRDMKKGEESDKEQTCEPTKQEMDQSAQKPESTQEIPGYPNGHVNYAFTNDDGTPQCVHYTSV